MYRNLSYPTLLRLSHLHCHVKLTGVQTVQSKVPSKAKVKQSKLFVFASPLSYQYVTIYLSKLLLFFPTTIFIAFRFTPLIPIVPIIISRGPSSGQNIKVGIVRILKAVSSASS